MRPRGYHHIPFTPEIWAKWLKRFNADEHTVRLRDGIEEMRRLLARRERRRV